MCHEGKSFNGTVVQWLKDAWAAGPDTAIISGFEEAQIVHLTELPAANKEMPPVHDEDDLPQTLASLFHSNKEDSDFDVFEETPNILKMLKRTLHF